MNRGIKLLLFFVLFLVVGCAREGKKEVGPILNEKQRVEVQNQLREMTGPVSLTLYTDREEECRFCPMARQILEEVADLSDRVSLTIKDFRKNADEARAGGITAVPGIQFDDNIPSRLRFYGVPTGHEFRTLIETLIAFSKGQAAVMPETRQALAHLKTPVTLKVMVSPS